MSIATDISPGKPAIVFTVIVRTEVPIRINRAPPSSFMWDQWRWFWYHFRWKHSFFSFTQWAFGSLGGEGKRMALVFVFTLCYTGLRAELGYPYVMAKLDEPI
jgi:hypothetical protein